MLILFHSHGPWELTIKWKHQTKYNEKNSSYPSCFLHQYVGIHTKSGQGPIASVAIQTQSLIIPTWKSLSPKQKRQTMELEKKDAMQTTADWYNGSKCLPSFYRWGQRDQMINQSHARSLWQRKELHFQTEEPAMSQSNTQIGDVWTEKRYSKTCWVLPAASANKKRFGLCQFVGLHGFFLFYKHEKWQQASFF